MTSVRPLTVADRAGWEALWNGYLEFYRVELPPEVTEATWRRLLDPGGEVHGLCADGDAGKLVGIVHYLFHPVTWAIAHRGYLEDLFVEPAARRTGIGHRLIEAVYSEADARGADQVYWLTEEGNATARRLYDRVGRLTEFVKYRR